MTICIFLSGIPCSGKSTIAKELLKYLPKAQWLDGDVIRNTPLAKDVGFSLEDRAKHILRMGQVANMLVQNGVTVICSFVSPSNQIRNEVRKMFKEGEFIEVFVSASQATCMKRDVKGMWAKAKAGEIKDFTGYSAPYEAPENPEIVVNADKESVEDSVNKILEYIETLNVFTSKKKG